MATDGTTGDILVALERATSDEPVATAGDVAEHVDVGQRTVLNYLNDLHTGGQVRKKAVGARSAVWWVSDDTTIPEPDQQHELAERIDDAIAALEVPGSGDRADARRDAVRRAVEHLRTEGPASKGTLEKVAFDPATGYSDPNSLYKNCLLDGLKAVADELDELTPSTTSAPWRFE